MVSAISSWRAKRGRVAVAAVFHALPPRRSTNVWRSWLGPNCPAVTKVRSSRRVANEDTGARVTWFRAGSAERFRDSAEAAFGADLRAVVLFGSAAEARLRATSDVNLVVVLRRFERAQAEQLQRPLRVAQAAARLTPMFLLESEVPMAAEAFAVKFDDILHRRALLFGTDPFEQLRHPARGADRSLETGAAQSEAALARTIRAAWLA